MSKELTEQWRAGTLERGYHYYKTKVGAEVIGYQRYGLKYPYNPNNDTIDSVKEVLAPVPSFADLCELKQDLEICREDRVELYSRLCKALTQLEEANKVIKFYADATGLTEEERQMSAEKYHLVYGLKACDYLERHGVK